jgi:N-glycosylase/DNA lyase
MITTDKEFYSSPYYFFLRDKGKDYSLYFSVEETLTEARKKDEMIKIPKNKVKHVKSYLEKLLKGKKKKSTKDISGELEELVNLDGAMSNSKIPILDPRLHPKKTMDQTVAAARITNDPISRGYRTYYGESIEEAKNEKKKTNKKIVYVAKEKNTKPLTISKDDLEKYMKEPRKLLSKLHKAGFNLGSGHEEIEFTKTTDDDTEYSFYALPYYGHSGQSVIFNKKIVNEEDMSAAFGYEETKDMDGKETYEYFKDELEMEPDEAKDRTEQQGKDPSGKRDAKSKYKKDPNFISRQIIPEIQKQKAIKMVEDLLMKKKNSDNSEVGKKEIPNSVEELPLLIRKNLKTLLRHVEKNGYSKEDLIKLIKKGE